MCISLSIKIVNIFCFFHRWCTSSFCHRTSFTLRKTKGINNFLWLSFPSSLPCPVLSSEVCGSFLGEGKLTTIELWACIPSLILKLAFWFLKNSTKWIWYLQLSQCLLYQKHVFNFSSYFSQSPWIFTLQGESLPQFRTVELDICLSSPNSICLSTQLQVCCE